MKYKFMDGTIIIGDEMAVIEYLKTNEYDYERFENVTEYLEHVQRNMWRFLAKSITFQGETEKERCRSFVDSLVEQGIIEMVEDGE